MYDYLMNLFIKILTFFLLISPFFSYSQQNSSIILKDKKEFSSYEKSYFGVIKFESPVYMSECILKKNDTEKHRCSDAAMLAYYNYPPLPPSYFEDARFIGKSITVKLKYLLSEKGKVITTKILKSSGDAFLDDLAATHVLNMIPFESAKEFEYPIKYWIPADIIFNF